MCVCVCVCVCECVNTCVGATLILLLLLLLMISNCIFSSRFSKDGSIISTVYYSFIPLCMFNPRKQNRYIITKENNRADLVPNISLAPPEMSAGYRECEACPLSMGTNTPCLLQSQFRYDGLCPFLLIVLETRVLRDLQFDFALSSLPVLTDDGDDDMDDTEYEVFMASMGE